MPWQLAQCPGFINCDNLTLEVEKGRRGKSRKIGQKAENNKTGWFLERPRENCPCCPLLPAYINFSSLNLRLFYVYIYNQGRKIVLVWQLNMKNILSKLACVSSYMRKGRVRLGQRNFVGWEVENIEQNGGSGIHACVLDKFLLSTDSQGQNKYGKLRLNI